MAYLLDANVFIQAKNLHYGLDFCPAFWDWLVESNAAGSVFSIEKVGDEIAAGADTLAKWADARGSGFFVVPDGLVLPALSRVSSWATAQSYEPAAVNTFLQVADFYLVAQALAHGHTVVTHEVAQASSKKIKIPNVCIGLGVKCMTPYECCGSSAPASCSGARRRSLRQIANHRHDSVGDDLQFGVDLGERAWRLEHVEVAIERDLVARLGLVRPSSAGTARRSASPSLG